MRFSFNTAARQRLAAHLTSLALAGVGGLGISERKKNDGPPRRPDAVETVATTEAPIFRRELTQSERRLTRSIFGDRLDPGAIEILYYARPHDKLASSVTENTIHIYGPRHALADYSASENPALFGIFVYDLTRLWQIRANAKERPTAGGGYDYTLDKTATFVAYSLTQQASMMEDYARRFLHRDHDTRRLAADSCLADNLLAKTVERAFPQLRETRTALEKRYTRKLTPREAALARMFFGDRLDTDAVGTQMNPRACGGDAIAATVQGNKVTYWGRTHHAPDFTSARDTFKFGIFMHEMTHVWQEQTRFRHTNCAFVNKASKYAYPLDVAKWRFEHYGIEQQGAMIEDYARYFLHPGRKTRYITATPDHLDALRQVVENRFPGAKRLREHFDANGALPGAHVAATRAGRFALQNNRI